MIRNHRFSIGVDLHKSSIQVCVLDAQGDVVSETRHVGSSLEEGLEVVQHLARWRKVGTVAVESLGMNRWFVNACQNASLRVVVVDPTKLNLRMLGKKTDRRDSYEIARRLHLGDIARNAVTYYPTDEEYGVRKILRMRHRLVEMRQKLVVQIRSLHAAYRVPCPKTSLYLPKNLGLLAQSTLPNEALQQSRDAALAALEGVQQAIVDLTRSIQKLANQPAVACLIEEIPSVGAQTAATLLFELGDVGRFRSAKAAASYAGLVPRVANSGDRQNHGRLTKRGNRELRWILSEMAVRLMSRNEVVKVWARPRLKRQHKNKVRMALARRLLVGIYQMLRTGERFTLKRCLGVRAA